MSHEGERPTDARMQDEADRAPLVGPIRRVRPRCVPKDGHAPRAQHPEPSRAHARTSRGCPALRALGYSC